MTNPIANWWRSRQFYAALKSNELHLATQLLEAIQQSGARLSVLEKTFRDKLQSEQHLENLEREILALRQQISQPPQTSEDHTQEITDLRRQLTAALEQRHALEQLLVQRKQEIESLSRDKQQVEQTTAALHERLKQKQQEVVFIQQQLQADGQTMKALQEQIRQQQEVASAQQQLEANGQAIRALYEQLTQQRQEVVSVRQQLEVNGQEIIALREQLRQKNQEFISAQQQLEVNQQEITALREQLKQKNQELISAQQQVLAHEQHIQELRQQQSETLNQKQRLEQLFGQKQQAVNSFSKNSQRAKQSLENLRRDLQRQLAAHEQEPLGSRQQLNNGYLLTPDINFIKSIANKFRIIERSQDLVECTGIDNYIFDELETNLVEYLQTEFDKYNLDRPSSALRNAMGDINSIRARGSQSGYDLAPYAYLMRYFLENVYCAYLAWLLIYRQGLLKSKANILDMTAGTGTVACGLALLLQSDQVTSSLQTHFSYYALEKQDSFQYHGFQFWRQYIDTQEKATNTYFRFDTTDVFSNGRLNKIPEAEFDFVVVFHRLFSDISGEAKSYEAYKEIFARSLVDKGYVLLITQGKKLLRTYNIRGFENHDQEQNLIQKLVADLGLNLEWYKYVTSTGERVFTGDFREYARQNLPPQPAMSVLMRQYLGTGYMRQKLRLGDKAYYTVDDYIILARK